MVLPLTFFVQTQTPEDVFHDPKVVGERTVSSKDYEFNFTHTREGDLAFFSKTLLPGGRRILIVFTTKKKGKWGGRTLFPFSGKYRDMDPFIHPDQSKMIFISERLLKYQKKS
ncbi:hypothetical protein [Xanthovirga aplysinae]|uniref:hypothetical protein n=1 Tax=Xanthovirga aplysinae TaxID=2529853 RepID=UPI0012BD07F1|nr:hypothetical protein [Xanthovirga aplysinae]MTI32106.1 hypothetical protein [Xanthovirga aplysinae]